MSNTKVEKEMYVKVKGDSSSLKTSMKQAEKSVDSFKNSVKDINNVTKDLSNSFTSLGNVVKGAFSVAAIKGAFNFSTAMATVAGRGEDALNVLSLAFGENASDIAKWSSTFASAVGRYKVDIMDMIANTKLLNKGIGLTDDSLNNLSKTLVQRAVDFASVMNKEDVDVLNAFNSALVGNSEALRNLGVDLTATAMQQYLYNKGITSSFSSLSLQEQQLYRVNKLLEDTAFAQNDAMNTAGDYNNQMKAFNATMTEFKTIIGTELIPPLKEMFALFNNNSEAISGILTPIFSALSMTVSNLAQALGYMKFILEPLGNLLSALSGPLSVLGTLFISTKVATLIGANAMKLFGNTTNYVSTMFRGFASQYTANLVKVSTSTSTFRNALKITIDTMRLLYNGQTLMQTFSTGVSHGFARLSQSVQLFGLEFGYVLKMSVANLKAFAMTAISIIGRVMAAFSSMVLSFGIFYAMNKANKAKQEAMNNALKNTSTAAGAAGVNMDNLAKSAKDAAKGVGNANKKINDSADATRKRQEEINKRLNDELERYIKERKALYMDWNNIFSGVDREKIGGNNIIKGLQQQVEALEDWEKAMEDVEDRLNKMVDAGIITPEQRDEILSSLRELGPEYVDEIQALANMTDEQFSEWTSLMVKKLGLANKLASEEAQDLIPSMLKEIEEALGDIEGAIDNLGGTLGDAIEGLDLSGTDFSGIGTDIGNGFLDEFDFVAKEVLNGAVIGGIFGAALGGAIGLMFGGPTGALVGAKWGAGLGAALGAGNYEAFNKAWEDFKLAFNGWKVSVGEEFGKLWDNFKQPWIDFGTNIGEHWNRLWSKVENDTRPVGQRIMGALDEGLNIAWDMTLGLLGQICTSVLNTFAQFFGFESIQDLGSDIILGFAQGIVNAMNAVFDTVGTLWNGILSVFGADENSKWWYDRGNDATFQLSTGIKNGTPLNEQTAHDLMTRTRSQFDNYSSDFRKIGLDATGSLKNAIQFKTPEVKETCRLLSTGAKKEFTDKINNNDFRNIGIDATNGLNSGMDSKKFTLGQTSRNIANEIKNPFSNSYSEYQTVGRNIVDGVNKGVDSNSGSLFDRMRNMANNALNAAKNALGIHSPSREFAKLGDFSAQGFIGGMEDGMESFARTVDLGTYTNTLDPTVMSENHSLVKNFSIYVDELAVREEADVEVIAQRLYELAESEGRTQGGIY